MRKTLLIGVSVIAALFAIAIAAIQLSTGPGGATTPAADAAGGQPLPAQPLALPPYPGPYAPPVAGPGTEPGATVAVPVKPPFDPERPAFGTPEWEQKHREKRETMRGRRDERRSAEDD